MDRIPENDGNKRGLGLGLKFVLLLVMISTITLGAGSVVEYNVQKEDLLDHLNEKTRILGHFASQISVEPILGYDFASLNKTMQDLHAQPDVVFAAIIGPNGQAMTSYIDAGSTYIKNKKINRDKVSVKTLVNSVENSSDVISMTFPIRFNDENLGNVMLSVSRQRMDDTLHQALIQRLVVSMTTIAILSLFIYVMYRSLTLRPVQRLVEGSRRIAAGVLNQEVKKDSDDELGNLTDSFNQMMHSLKTISEQKELALQDLEEARNVLEIRVEERTRELSMTNESLTNEINDRRRIESELREINRELKNAQTQLLQAEKMASVGQLAAGVAHEINNPVGYINSNVVSLHKYVEDMLNLIHVYENCEDELSGKNECLQRIRETKNNIDFAFLEEDIADLIHETKDGINRVKKIVEDLKDYSHVNEIEWQLADLHKGIDSTLNIVNNEIKYKADVIKEYGDLPPVQCVPSQLNQIFTNLLVNASHAIETHGEITISTRQEDDGVVLEFSDTGNGIDEEHVNKIFEPFFTTKPIGKGTGLGLSLSYGIIQKHHGTIAVESEVGVGTTFRIWLPIQQPDENTEEIERGGTQEMQGSG